MPSMTQPLEVLLVEDNEGDVELVRGALQDDTLPCNLSVVNNGREALYWLLKQNKWRDAPRPHLIFLDLNLSGMAGQIVLETIKQDRDLKTIPVIVLTSSRAPSDIQETYAHHANCYVTKPFDGREFKSTIRQAIHFWKNIVQLPHASATCS